MTSRYGAINEDAHTGPGGVYKTQGIKFCFQKDWCFADESLEIFLKSEIQIKPQWDVDKQILTYHVFITEIQFKSYISCLWIAGIKKEKIHEEFARLGYNVM